MLKWMIKGHILNNYIEGCKDAFKNITTFKGDSRLTAIFEHCSIEIAKQYQAQVEAQGVIKDTNFTNDFYGGYAGPTLSGRSPSTWQYIGVLSNLVSKFGSLSGLRIVEIGGGYGGQCRTICDMFVPECYHIIDLPEVCELQRKYCGGSSFTEPTGLKYDLVISNYALSEIVDNSLYIDEVLRRSTHGYITCNTDLVQLDWPHERVPDVKGERETNYILIW